MSADVNMSDSQVDSQSENSKSKVKSACQPFYLYLNGRPNDGSLTLSTGFARVMKNNWEVALSSITYSESDKFQIEGDELEMIACVDSANRGVLDRYQRENYWQEFELIKEYPNNRFDGFERCLRLRMKDCVSGKTLVSPSGRFTPSVYFEELSKSLKTQATNYAENFIKFDGHKLSVMFDSNWKRRVICFFPLFNEKIRKLIGMPDPDSDAFVKMINTPGTVTFEDLHIPLPKTPIIIESNLCEHNGVAQLGHKCNTRTDGHVLRIISQGSEAEFNKTQHVEYDESNRIFIPLRGKVFTEVKLNLISADTLDPTVFQGPVAVSLYFRPRPGPECSAIESETHPRRSRETVEETMLILTGEYD